MPFLSFVLALLFAFLFTIGCTSPTIDTDPPPTIALNQITPVAPSPTVEGSVTQSQTAPPESTALAPTIESDIGVRMVCLSCPDGVQTEPTFGRGPSISHSGQWIAFSSEHTALIPGGITNGMSQILVRNLVTGETRIASIAPDGSQANNSSHNPSVSDDGRYVTFVTIATNLPGGNKSRVFLHDFQTGETLHISEPRNASELFTGASMERSAMSADGRYIVFTSISGLDPANALASGLYLYDTQSASYSAIPGPDGRGFNDADSATISADGRFIAFWTSEGYQARQAVVYDRVSQSTELVSVSDLGEEANENVSDARISGDGRFVVFVSSATNLVPNDTNGVGDIFVHDRETRQTERVSIAPDGSQLTERSDLPDITYDGRYVVYESATNNEPGARHEVFLHDRETDETLLISVGVDGSVADGTATDARISSDGSFMAFFSSASNLVPGEILGAHVFIRYLGGD